MKKVNLAENYKRLFGHSLTEGQQPTEQKQPYKLTESNVQTWNRLQTTLMAQYNNKVILQVLGNNVYVNNKLVESTEAFFKRSMNGMLTTLRSKLNG